MSVLQIVLIAIIAIIVLGWILLAVVVKGKEKEGEQTVREALGTNVKSLDTKAICRGTESGEFNAWVGMGTLGVSEAEIVFLRWSPRGVLKIVREDIVDYGVTAEHLGRENKRPLIQVRYASPDNPDGEEPGVDSIAWQVSNPEVWNDALEGSGGAKPARVEAPSPEPDAAEASESDEAHRSESADAPSGEGGAGAPDADER